MSKFSGKNTSCSRCGQEGHWARNCTVERAPCFKCGEKDHWVRDCPKSAGTKGSEGEAVLRAKLDAMQARIDESDRRFEKDLARKYEKERKEWDSHGVPDEAFGSYGFMSWEEYRARAIGGKVMEDYYQSVKQAEIDSKKAFIDKQIAQKEKEIAELKAQRNKL